VSSSPARCQPIPSRTTPAGPQPGASPIISTGGGHRLYTIEHCKLALSPHDDKRYFIPPSNIQTLPWGHYKSSDSERVSDLVER